MRKLLIGAGLLAVLLVAAAALAPFLVPVERYRALIEARVQKETGRAFQIRGPMKLSVLPNLRLELNDVHLGNRPGGRAPEMASLKRLDLGVALRPLLDRRIEVQKIILVEPRIALEVDRNGAPNWRFNRPAEAPDQTRTGEGRKLTLRFAGLSLKDGRLSYADLRDKAAGIALDKVNLSVGMSNLDTPAELKGDLVYRGRRVNVSARAGKPRALVEGGPTPIRAQLEAAPVKASFGGSASGGKTVRADGDLRIDAGSIADLIGWLGTKPLAGKPPVRSVSLASRVSAGADRARLTGLTVKADALEGRGDLDVAWTPRPRVAGTLAFGMVDLDLYLPPSEASRAKAGQDGASGWSDKPIDLSALRKADADLHFKMAGLKRNRLTLGPTAISIALRGGRLEASAPNTPLFGGTAKGLVRIDAAGPVAGLSVDTDVAGVQAEPLLAALADSHRLEGTTNASIRVQARGASPRAMVSSLNGTASLAFLDGAIKGINIASALRQLKTVYLDPNAGASQKTDFAELSGNFAIRNGIAHTEDLKMLAPLLRLRGKGDVLLPERRIAMRLEPELVGTLSGQGGEEARGIRVPVLVSGPLDHPSFAPDLQGMAEKAVRKRLENVLGDRGGSGGRVGGFLRGLTGSPAANDAQGGAEPKPANPVENLKHLFGR